jgi:hypothetical protein
VGVDIGVASISTVSPHPVLPPPGGKGHMRRAPIACRTLLRLPPPWGKELIEVQTGIRAISGQLRYW